MLTKEQILALNSKGYDLVFEYKDKIYSIKTDSLSNWSEEKKLKFEQESGLTFSLIDDEWVFYNPEQYAYHIDNLKYIGDNEKPDQPINLTDYYDLFYEWKGSCLDLSHWDVSQVTQFDDMFGYCKNLQSLNISNWDVSNGEKFNYMFYQCSNLQSLDLSNWNVSKCSDFSYMFTGCTNLQSLDLSGWDVSKGETFINMFRGCCNLQSLNLSRWNVSKGKCFQSMFWGCASLQSLDLSGWGVSNCKDFSNMFRNCDNLQSLDLSDWDVSKGEDFFCMFCDCKNLQSLDLSGWDVSKGKCFNNTFYNTDIAKINEGDLVELLQQGRWSEVKQSCVQGSTQNSTSSSLQESSLF